MAEYSRLEGGSAGKSGRRLSPSPLRVVTSSGLQRVPSNASFASTSMPQTTTESPFHAPDDSLRRDSDDIRYDAPESARSSGEHEVLFESPFRSSVDQTRPRSLIGQNPFSNRAYQYDNPDARNSTESLQSAGAVRGDRARVEAEDENFGEHLLGARNDDPERGNVEDDEDHPPTLMSFRGVEKGAPNPYIPHKKWYRIPWERMPNLLSWAPKRVQGWFSFERSWTSYVFGLVMIAIFIVGCIVIFYTLGFSKPRFYQQGVGLSVLNGIDETGFNLTRYLNVSLTNPNFFAVTVKPLELWAVYNGTYFFGQTLDNSGIKLKAHAKNTSVVIPFVFSYLTSQDANTSFITQLALECGATTNDKPEALPYELLAQGKTKAVSAFNIQMDMGRTPGGMTCDSLTGKVVRRMAELRGVTLADWQQGNDDVSAGDTA
ncbi:hypothetical protein SAICODRAFT_217278 [Saitoella complicata NRRL Y-17804]|nr:uncharacterized protein SAICODRAFT_217278 [Saitoella complicata NRRL Y-17804]ODQ53795.1 hypothetical protein SAICODRAFT_217278 [Saitoella complicata NRRL Y-17804]